ncbi:MAG: TIGR02996 domain-containing protein [Polyangiaceae bacterium]
MDAVRGPAHSEVRLPDHGSNFLDAQLPHWAVMLTFADVEKSLNRGDRVAALSALSLIWLEKRQPRVADLIEQLSAELVRERGPLASRGTLDERLEVWRDHRQKQDLVAIGQLLAVPWPGKWQSTLPFIEELALWPADPRIASALARLYAERPFISNTAYKLYVVVGEQLARHKDLRTLPALQNARPLQVRRFMDPALFIAEAFPAGAATFSAEEEAAVQALEARWAADESTAKLDERTEAELLTAIHEHPEDLSFRLVYADWLTARGDPRGELISLQVARTEGRSTDKTQRRERALIDEYGEKWAGALQKVFHQPLFFENGFLAGGKIRGIEAADLAGLEQDPGWQFIRLIHHEGYSGLSLSAILDLPMFSGVRVIHGAGHHQAVQLARGEPRAIGELHVDVTSQFDGATVHPLATCSALPQLRRLRINWLYGRSPHWLFDAPVLSRLDTLIVTEVKQHEWEKLASCGGTLLQIEVIEQVPRHDEATSSGWRFVLSRSAAPGPFDQLYGEWVLGPNAHDIDKRAGIQSLLDSLPDGWLKGLRVAPSRALVFAKDQEQTIQDALKRFPALTTLETPWDLSSSNRPIEAPKPFVIRLNGDFYPEGRLAHVWERLLEMGCQYDSFRVGSNQTHRDLGRDPRAKLLKWAENSKVDSITLYKNGADGECTIRRGVLHAELARHLPPASELLDWLAPVLQIAPVSFGHVAPDTASTSVQLREEITAAAWSAPIAWITIFPAGALHALTDEDLENLRQAPGLAELSWRRTPSNLMVSLGRTRATAEMPRTFAQALRRTLDTKLEKLLGFHPMTRISTALEPLKTLDLPELELKPHQLRPSVTLKRTTDTYEASLFVEVYDMFSAPRVHAELQHQTREAYGAHVCKLTQDPMPFTTIEDANCAVVHIAKQAVEQASAFFANPAPLPAKKRGR